MKSINLSVLILSACVSVSLILSGCQKSSAGQSCDGSTPPEITSSTTSLTAGDKLELFASDLFGAEYYRWTGPNGFTSEERNPIIEGIQPSQSGVYEVEVGVTGGCVFTAKSDSIFVVLPPAACNPADNTARIEGLGSISVYSTTGAASGGSFFLTANGTGGDIELEFPGTDRPSAGIYNIRGLGDQFLKGDVRLRLVAQSNNWPASDGEVHVEVNANNKLVATFCSVPVTAQTVTLNTTASGKLVED